ncbi:hypothetical protein [Paraburkholderia acidicola]|uniref:Uncharacterized protein n=1 Tax=Paraburkholderia acidicola TaxID=1912599 RepID=A0ABV1LWJ2_9BURK|nr:hypothetical protein [Paraburkholderia acidicola]
MKVTQELKDEVAARCGSVGLIQWTIFGDLGVVVESVMDAQLLARGRSRRPIDALFLKFWPAKSRQ